MPRPSGQLLLVSHRDPVLWRGGGPTYVRAWARAVQASGLQPVIVTLGDSAEVADSPYGPVHRVRSPIGRSSSLTFAVNAPVLGAAVIGLLRDRPGRHVVHGFAGWPLLPPLARRNLRRRGVHITQVGTVWTSIRHEQDAKLASSATSGRFRRQALSERAWNRVANRPLERRAMRSNDVVVVNYEATARIAAAEWGADLPLRRLPYLAESAFDEGPRQVPEVIADWVGSPIPLIVTMSRHTARKGLDVLIRALAALRDAGVDFHACLPSSGRLRQTHQRLVRDLGLADRVRLPGMVDDPTAFIRAADVFVLPSLEEGSGSVSVLEALQAGVPVVSTDVDGMPEDLVHGVLVPPNDAGALADALTPLLASRSLRSAAGARNRALYEERFSAPVVVPAIGRFYRDLGLVADN